MLSDLSTRTLNHADALTTTKETKTYVIIKFLKPLSPTMSAVEHLTLVIDT